MKFSNKPKKTTNNKTTPLDNWSKETDPATMSGDQWVDKNQDIGSNSTENKELAEGLPPQSGIFMHPTHDVSYGED